MQPDRPCLCTYVKYIGIVVVNASRKTACMYVCASHGYLLYGIVFIFQLPFSVCLSDRSKTNLYSIPNGYLMLIAILYKCFVLVYYDILWLLKLGY